MAAPIGYAFFILPKIVASRILTQSGPFIRRAGLTRFAAGYRTPESVEGSKFAMFDIGMIAIGVGFFVTSILYVLACERM